MVDVLAARLLRRHVIRRAEHHPRLGEPARPRVHGLRDAEVEQLHEQRVLPVAHEEHVVGLEIAVHHVPVVRERQRLRDLHEHVEELIAREPLLQRLAEIHPLQELHRHVELPARELPEIGHLDDVPALDAVGGLRLADEALQHALGLLGARAQHLHRERLAHDDVAAPVHHAHAALADERLDEVPPVDRLADELFGPACAPCGERHEPHPVALAVRAVGRVLGRARRADLHSDG
ncbi:MAG: hypothetical protein R3B70_25070 [Polyangiaceae bacterium]